MAARALDPAEQMQFADGLYGRGLYDLASREYRMLITNAAATRLDAAFFRLGECQRLLKNKAAADEAYGQLVQRFPQSEFRYKGEFRRAEMHVTGGEFLLAINYFRGLLAANPPDDIRAPALYYHGYAQDRLLLTNEAFTAFAELVERFPASPFHSLACVSLGELKEKRGMPAAEARALYGQAADKPASPRVGAEALFKLADLEFRARNFAASADAYTKLFATYPKDERAVSNQLSAAWAFHNAGRFPITLETAQSQLSAVTGPTRAEWLYLKANAERQLKKEEEAIADYAALLQQYPGSPLAGAAAYEQATLLFSRNRHADVLAVASMIGPTNAAGVDVHWMLAESHAAMKQTDPAIANYRKIVEQFPKNERAPLALFRAAKLLQDAGRLEEASVGYRRIAQDYPQHALAGDALAASAECQIRRGQKAEAVADWLALGQAHTNYVALDQALFAKAQAEVDLNKPADAITTLEQFIRLCPRSPLVTKAHYLRGVLMEKAGQLDPAAYHYAAALALKPDPDLAQQLQFRRIAVLQRQGKPDDAAAALQPLLASPALQKMPLQLIDWLARWQLAKTNYAAAIEAATHLATLAQADAAMRQSAWFIAGQAQQGLKDFAKARVAYETMLAVTNVPGRERVEASFRLGEVALALGDQTVAAAAFSRSAEQANTDAMIDLRARSYHGLGLAASARQQWEEASRYFMSVAVLFDEPALTSECLFRAAEAFGQQGRTTEREKTIEELKRRYPESEWAKK